MLKRPHRVFYGWWIVGAGFGIQALVSALLLQGYGAYVVLLRQEFGWSKTMLSAAYSMSRAESGMLGPVQGWLIDRFGPRASMRAGMVIFAVGFMLFSQVHSPVTFFLTFFLMSVGSSVAGFLPVTVAIVNWFRRRRAFALSLGAIGWAVGGLLTPLVVWSLESFGWRATAFGSGVVVLLVGLPLSQVVRHRPEPYGYRPDGDPAEEPVADGASDAGEVPGRAAQVPDFTAREAMRTPAFWFISLGHASALLVVSAVMVHLVVHVHEGLGYTLGQAAAIVALMTAMQVVGQVVGGFLGDRVSKRTIAVACMASHATGLLVLASATALWMVIAFTVLHGVAWGTRGPLMQAIRADYFGRASFGAIMGWSSMVVMFGNMAGPLVAGILADQTGSYTAGFRVLAVLAGLGSFFFVLARRPAPPRGTRGVADTAAAAAGSPAA